MGQFPDPVYEMYNKLLYCLGSHKLLLKAVSRRIHRAAEAWQIQCVYESDQFVRHPDMIVLPAERRILDLVIHQ
ncbi:hypothetical protein D3C79_1021350 [compost metagenome]